MQPQTLPDDEIDLMEIAHILLDSKWLIMGITLISICLAGIYAYTTTPIYRVNAVVYQANHANWTSKAETSPTGILSPVVSNNTNTAILTMKSRQFLSEFIDTHGIESIIKQQTGSKDAYTIFNDLISVSTGKKHGSTQISIDWHEPVQAANWINTLIRELDDKLRRDAIAHEEKSIQQVKQQLANLPSTAPTEWRSEMQAILSAKKNNVALLNASGDYILRVIDPAVPSDQPIKPKKKMILILGGVLGLMFGIFLAWGKHAYVQYRNKSKC